MIPLSEKDLSFAKDAISWELIAAKKAYQYSHQSVDAECRQLCEQAAKQHQKNIEQIVQHIGQHANQMLQSQMNAQ